jgi:hypothetical protein
MFDAVVVTLCVESVANRAALVVRIKDSAPVHCTLSSSLSTDVDAEEEGAAKRAPASDAKGKGAAGQSFKKKKTL